MPAQRVYFPFLIYAAIAICVFYAGLIGGTTEIREVLYRDANDNDNDIVFIKCDVVVIVQTVLYVLR